jgi:hypothetical protein
MVILFIIYKYETYEKDTTLFIRKNKIKTIIDEITLHYINNKFEQ